MEDISIEIPKEYEERETLIQPTKEGKLVNCCLAALIPFCIIGFILVVCTAIVVAVQMINDG